MEPFVTLWHWTNPVWLEEYGGWESKDTAKRFLRFVEKVTSEFKEDVKCWFIFNEQNTFVGHGYVQANRPPQRKSLWRANKAVNNFIRAHKDGYKLIHSLDPKAQVGISHFAVFMKPYKNLWKNNILIRPLNYVRNWRFFEGMQGYYDFIGIQYYRLDLINLCGWGGTWGFIDRVAEGGWKNDLNWVLYPEGI